MLSVNTYLQTPRMGHVRVIFQALRDASQVQLSKYGALYVEITLGIPKNI